MNEDQPKAPRRHRRRTFYPHKLTLPLNGETYARIEVAAEPGLPVELDRFARLQRKANTIRQDRQERGGRA
ncbi:MAG: hypothetical protein GDA41_12675 [Rhodospirillales bacterium]|nr:hypothetical protein [Rhodospirillales bacterium]